MVQVSDKVGTWQKGSIKAVAGSGMASMSEASMDFQPRMDEPSKPNPSEKESTLSSSMGQLKCCQVPKVSTNFTSKILAPCFLAISKTLCGVGAFVVVSFFAIFVLFVQVLTGRLCQPATRPADTASVKSVLSGRSVIAFLAVFDKI